MNLLSPPPPRHVTSDCQAPVIVHVAVGRSRATTVALIAWTLRQFGCKEVVLVHVHRPSLTIPTLLGKLPVDGASEESVMEYRKEEKREMEIILEGYLKFCYKAQVQAKIIMMEAGDVQRGIVEMITKYGIHKLVMGAKSDKYFNVKGKCNKTILSAPLFCEILFVSKGKHIWTREAPEGRDGTENVLRERVWSSSLQNIISNLSCNTEFTSSNLFTTDTCERKSLCIFSRSHEEEPKLVGFIKQVQEIEEEIGTSRQTTIRELEIRKKMELSASEALDRAKVCEAAIKQEIKAIEHLQDILRTTKMQQEETMKNNCETMRELKNANISIALLELHAKKLTYNCEVAATELEHIYSSIKYLNEMKEAHKRGKKLRSFISNARSPNYYKLLGSHSDNFIEFSALDIKTATCDFSQSFKLGEGGYKCIFKGEILDRTVVIKKLHQQNGQGQKEYQQEVSTFSKLKHPHLMNLIGACPELLSLVYEYLPNGTLRHRLSSKAAKHLDWKTRIRIIFEISSALLFLNSSKPERIIHGNLNLDNIFLDSNLNCKIGDFSKCSFISENTTNHASLYHEIEPQGDFWYKDPEYQRTRVLTSKSDVYSLGVIILQMITGKSTIGLVNEVRNSAFCDKLCMMLDTNAGKWPPNVVKKLVELGLGCTEMNDQERLELTPEVVRGLKQLYLTEEMHAPPFFLCPILQEIMTDPQVAADGFTYEGSAIKKWLLNGRSTSPMTNLELSHLNLAPNHALRFAIQDWLCQSCEPS